MKVFIVTRLALEDDAVEVVCVVKDIEAARSAMAQDVEIFTEGEDDEPGVYPLGAVAFDGLLSWEIWEKEVAE